MGDFTWRVSDCEELVGGYSQGGDECYSMEITSPRLIPVVVCEVQVVASDEVLYTGLVEMQEI